MKIYEFYEDKDNYYIIIKILEQDDLFSKLFIQIYISMIKDSFHPEELNINF